MSTYVEAEHPRHDDGKFAAKSQSDPEVALGVMSRGDDRAERASALAELTRILQDHPEALAAAQEHMESTVWRPDLYWVDYDSGLDNTLGAFIRGDDDPVNELVHSMEDDNWEQETEACEQVVGGEDIWNELDEDTQQELREWAHTWDSSDPIAQMVKNTRPQLMQLPVVDDGAFADALSEALSKPVEKRYAAVEEVLMSSLAAAGIENSLENRQAVQSLLDETGLADDYNAHGQWQLRLLTYDRIDEYAMSDYSTHGSAPRNVTLRDAHVVLIDKWNGRGMDVQLSGDITSRLSAETPATLDSEKGHGYGWDDVAGVHKPAYAPAATKVKVQDEL